MNTDDSPTRAPDGAACSRHPDRPARWVCPRCGALGCASCWQQGRSVCDACAEQQGSDGEDESFPAIAPPFEDERLALGPRLLGTLKDAFYPRASAPGFALSRVERAIPFFLMTALPLGALAGVIPFTKTLLFGPGAQVERVGDPSDMEVILDVARAMAAHLALDGVVLLALALPYLTLSRSYGRPGAANAAASMLLYRAWLLPTASLATYMVIWLVPSADLARILTVLVYLPCLVLLVYAMWFTARHASGIPWHLSLAVCAVPWVLAAVVSGIAAPALSAWLDLPTPTVEPADGTRV